MRDLGSGIVRSFVNVASLALTFCVASAHASDPVDYKVLLDGNETASATLARLQYARILAEGSYLYYFDTRDLKLFAGGVTIRARRTAGLGAQVVVKSRPLERDDLDPTWYDVAGLVCETDATPVKKVPSCAIRRDVVGRSLDDVVVGNKELSSILNPDQLYFANDFGAYDKFAPHLLVLGPIISWKWSVPNRTGWKVEAEYWKLPNGREFIELSIRGLETEQIRMANAMTKVMADRHVDAASANINKTAEALKALKALVH